MKNNVVWVKMHLGMTEFRQKLAEFRRIPRNSKTLQSFAFASCSVKSVGHESVEIGVKTVKLAILGCWISGTRTQNVQQLHVLSSGTRNSAHDLLVFAFKTPNLQRFASGMIQENAWDINSVDLRFGYSKFRSELPKFPQKRTFIEKFSLFCEVLH